MSLKARLGRIISTHTVLAGVLARPPGVPYDTLMVDAGRVEGVVMGQRVSAGGTTLVGTVGEVYEYTARVILFSSPGESYSVLLRGTEPLTVEGQGAGSLVGQVPVDTVVSVGDVVVFPGVAAGFSGVVSGVVVHEGESFKTLYLHLPVDPLTLTFVEIET